MYATIKATHTSLRTSKNNFISSRAFIPSIDPLMRASEKL